MVQRTYENCHEAWSGICKDFINLNPELFSEGNGTVITGSAHCFVLNVLITNPIFREDFNFGKIFGYTQTKWTSLISNYLDLDTLDIFRDHIRELEKLKTINRNYHIAINFADAHNNGKGCLVSAVCSRFYNIEKPRLTVFSRASDIVTRLPLDMMLLSRMGEYIYGNTDFDLELIIRSAFADDISILLYNGVEPIEPLIEAVEDEDRKKKLKKALRRVKKGGDDSMKKYQANFRVIKVFHPEEYPPKKDLFPKDCIIGNWEGVPLPKECPSIIVRNQIKNAYDKFIKRYGLDLSNLVDKKRRSYSFKDTDINEDMEIPDFDEEEVQEESED